MGILSTIWLANWKTVESYSLAARFTERDWPLLSTTYIHTITGDENRSFESSKECTTLCLLNVYLFSQVYMLNHHSNTVGSDSGTVDTLSSDDITTCDQSPPTNRPGKGQGQRQGLQNVRLIRADATMLFEGHVSAASLSEICIFFPDPWPNIPRDLQRRVVRLHMLDLFATCLRPHGLLRVATDVQEYADHVRTTVQRWNPENSNTG